MPSIAVIAPSGLLTDPLPADTVLLEFERWDEARAALLASYDAAVFVSDGIPLDRLPVLAGAVRSAGYPVVEVRSGAWDGVEHSTLSAACKGVISGFGVDGVQAAVRLLTASLLP